MKTVKSSIFAVLMIVLMVSFYSQGVFAKDLDAMIDSSPKGNTSQTQGVENGDSDDALLNYMQNYKPITNENMEMAEQISNPIVNLIGNAIGVCTLVSIALLGFTTGVDFIYLSAPFMRNYLVGKNFVSDEARACLGVAGGNQGMSGSMGSPTPTMQGGTVESGGTQSSMMQGGATTGNNSNRGNSTKVVMLTYLKMRSFVIILFIVATILLTSTVLFDCGINVALLLQRVLNGVNNFIANMQL